MISSIDVWSIFLLYFFTGVWMRSYYIRLGRQKRAPETVFPDLGGQSVQDHDMWTFDPGPAPT